MRYTNWERVCISGTTSNVDGITGHFSCLSAASDTKLLETPETLAVFTAAIRSGRAMLWMASDADDAIEDHLGILRFPEALATPNSPSLDPIRVRIERLIETDQQFTRHLDPLIDEMLGLRLDMAEVSAR